MKTSHPKKKNLNAESYFVGDEPVWGNKNELSLITALSWYSNQKDWKDSKKYAIDYAKFQKLSKEIIQKLESTHEDLFTNLGFVCRMTQRGAKLQREDWISERINQIVNLTTKKISISEEETQKIQVKSIQDKIFDQATQYINEIEGHIDEFIKTKSSDFKCYEWFITNSVKPIYMSHIKDHYNPLIEELTLAINKKDEQLVESYSHWTKKDLKTYLDFVNSIINDCEKYSGNVKTVRKTRKKKVVTADKKIAKLQYKKEDTENKIVSINPTDIISASQLWVYNTKYKKLGVYYSKDDSGFSVKGTTIENFDDITSIAKTLRKPLEILPLIVKGKKTDLKKVMKELKTKEEKLTGRINSETVLLKIIK